MPNDGFARKQQEIKLKMETCSALNFEEYKKCQTEVDNLQNQLAAELNSAANVSDVKVKALGFLLTKIGVIRTNANKVQSAVIQARSDFKEILEKKDYGFLDAVLDVLWIVAGSAVPALGAAALPLKTWRDSPKLINRFVGEFGRRNGNIDYSLINEVKSRMAKIEAKNNQPISDVFDKALLQVQGQLDIADSLTKDFYEKLKANQITESFDIEALWKGKEFGEYSTELSVDYLTLSNLILYKALENYAKQSCVYVLTSASKDAMLAEQNSDKYGQFKGMSQASRYAIYARFGDSSNPRWMGGNDYPQISGYRDMLIKWNVRIEIKKGSSPTPVYSNAPTRVY